MATFNRPKLNGFLSGEAGQPPAHGPA